MSYARLCGFAGEVVAEQDGTVTLEFRPDLNRYEEASNKGLVAHDPPSLLEIAEYFTMFWDGGEPLGADNGLFVGRRLEVLRVALASDVLRVTVRRLD